ncbi:MAG TPA: hypothetical protein VGU25_10690 [Acidobacteriaceae bacterium]|nr:hypothetical protein [Acidobacteriaceae bacterium]
MRRLLRLVCVVAAGVICIEFPVRAQQKAAPAAKTDAQMGGFSGPIKVVMTTREMSGGEWRQPDGPGLVLPAGCDYCEFAPDGSFTKAGQFQGGNFRGTLTSYDRDAKGRIVRQRDVDAETAALMREVVFGPFGKTEETHYRNGKVDYRMQIWYDANGRETDFESWDGKEVELGRSHTVYGKGKDWIERDSWGKGVLEARQTWNAETKVETFTTFDEAGAVKLAWTIKDKKIVEFRENSPSPNQYGDSWFDPDDPNNQSKTVCQSDGKCEHFVIHYEYLDSARWNATSVEWRDSAGKVLYGAYYEYEMDAHGNWTHRKVFVTGPEQAERKLYEEDARTVVYWER